VALLKPGSSQALRRVLGQRSASRPRHQTPPPRLTHFLKGCSHMPLK
jgi:hypothetical protein